MRLPLRRSTSQRHQPPLQNNQRRNVQRRIQQAGLFRTGYAYGLTIGDYDNDGFEDIFITYWGQNVLYRNNGDGTFTDVTSKANLLSPDKNRFGSGCTFVDFDRDGKLDLFVSNYVGFDPSTIPRTGSSGSSGFRKRYIVNCGPRGLPYGRHSLYRNDGDGTFTDVTESAGIGDVQGGFGLTAIAADFDNDGWPDIYVACDFRPASCSATTTTAPLPDLDRGIALSDDGMEQAVGLALADFKSNGR